MLRSAFRGKFRSLPLPAQVATSQPLGRTATRGPPFRPGGMHDLTRVVGDPIPRWNLCSAPAFYGAAVAERLLTKLSAGIKIPRLHTSVGEGPRACVQPGIQLQPWMQL